MTHQPTCRRLVKFLFLVLLFTRAASQNNKGDSLALVIAANRQDTGHAFAALKLAWIRLQATDYDSARKLAEHSSLISRKINYAKGQAECHNISGVLHSIKGLYGPALTEYLAARRINERRGDDRALSNNLVNIGVIHMYLRDYPKAVNFLREALSRNGKVNDTSQKASILLNMALVYRNWKKHDTSIYYYGKVRELNADLNNPRMEANVLMSLGLNYHDIADAIPAPEKDTKTALYEKALRHYLAALILQDSIGDKFGEAINRSCLANVYANLGDSRRAEKMLDSAFLLSRALGLQENLASCERAAVNLMRRKGDYKSALEHYEKYLAIKDSIYSSEKRKAIVEKEAAFEFEKKETLLKAENERIQLLAEQRKKQDRLALTAAIIVLLVTTASLFVIINRLRVTRRQKHVIETQKTEVEMKSNEIRESITYARHLQIAILPPDDFLSTIFPQSFVLYLPKDIVAGDFYWVEQAGDWRFIAAADCTGHGVPGAMVSVVCSNALNRAVREFDLTQPGEILDRATTLVLETFARSDKRIMDGMDISLLAMNDRTQEIMWAGANNNLVYVTSAGEMFELQADKQPVGFSEARRKFTTHTLNSLPGTTFYLFTDGYADQFGGAAGKKYKYSQFRKSLVTISSQMLPAQRDTLLTNFLTWKNDLEQVDDVCVIGLRI